MLAVTIGTTIAVAPLVGAWIEMGYEVPRFVTLYGRSSCGSVD